jgi:hypothetical protein
MSAEVCRLDKLVGGDVTVAKGCCIGGGGGGRGGGARCAGVRAEDGE